MKNLRLLAAVVILLGPLSALAQTSEPAHIEKLAPGEIRAPEAFAMGNLLETVEPTYPDEARNQHIAGKVILKVVIDKEGKVSEATPVEGDPLLSAATVAAVKQWKFRSYLLNNERVAVQTTATAEFVLDPPAVHIPKPYRGPVKLRVSQGVAEGLLLQKVDPLYPEEAKQKRIQGEVLLQAHIDKSGNVVDLKVMRGHPLLAQAAMDAARQWKYRPYLLNGEPVEIETTILIQFFAKFR